MNSARRPMSLARQNAGVLVAVFVIFELLAAAAVVYFLMMPMARRSAADLAGLMVLSAQTWSELPPATRPAFERELMHTHVLALRAETPATAHDEWHEPYVYFLERALWALTDDQRHLSREEIGGEDWMWAALPSGEDTISVGFPLSRIASHPMLTLLVSSLLGLALALLAAIWLARRIVAPLNRLEQAAGHVGRGEAPEFLDETGPRELAALAARFNAMARQVRALLDARTTLLAGLSHDLRTPLARMRVALTLLEDRPSPRTLHRLERDIEEMDRLIGNVLDLARGLQGEPPSRFDLHALLVDLAANCTAPERVALQCPPLQLTAPRLDLRRALGNLLENALLHARQGPVDIAVQIEPGQLRIGVLDRGPGIPEERMEDVFEPFYRLDPSRSPATGGAGLGLAIVRQITDRHGWSIQLRAREDGGLEAWLQLSPG